MPTEEVEPEKTDAGVSDEPAMDGGLAERSICPSDSGSWQILGGELLERLDRLTQLFEEKLAYDQFKEGQITKLHAELQEYKTDLLAKTILPFVNGAIRIHDDLKKMLEAARDSDWVRSDPPRLLRSLETCHEDIEGLLADNGITPYEMPGEAFDPHRQRALRTISTADPQLFGRVAQRLRPGFERGKSTVIKERVAVYVPASKNEAPPKSVGGTDSTTDHRDKGLAEALELGNVQTSEL